MREDTSVETTTGVHEEHGKHIGYFGMHQREAEAILCIIDQKHWPHLEQRLSGDGMDNLTNGLKHY